MPPSKSVLHGCRFRLRNRRHLRYACLCPLVAAHVVVGFGVVRSAPRFPIAVVIFSPRSPGHPFCGRSGYWCSCCCHSCLSWHRPQGYSCCSRELSLPSWPVLRPLVKGQGARGCRNCSVLLCRIGTSIVCFAEDGRRLCAALAMPRPVTRPSVSLWRDRLSRYALGIGFSICARSKLPRGEYELHVLADLNYFVSGDSLEPPVGHRFFDALERITQEASFLNMGGYVFPAAHFDDFHLVGLGADLFIGDNCVRGIQALIGPVLRQRQD